MLKHAVHADQRASSTEHLSPVSPVLPHLVYVKATVQGLQTPIVPFALLYSDPVAEFSRGLEIYRRAAGTEELDVGTLRDAWNEQFVDLRPEQQFFVLAWSAVQGVSSVVARASGLLCHIATPGPLNRRWFTTRAVWRAGELVAWCQAIELQSVAANHMTVVMLSEERMIRLAMLP